MRSPPFETRDLPFLVKQLLMIAFVRMTDDASGRDMHAPQSKVNPPSIWKKGGVIA